MRLVICDNQRILAEALAAARVRVRYQVLAVTTTVTRGSARLALADQMSGSSN